MSDSGRIRKAIKATLKAEISALKELESQISNIGAAVSLLSLRKGKIIVTGVGKSAYVAMKVAATLTSLGSHTVFLHPVDALHGDSGMIMDGDIFVAISFSGESPEITRIVRHIKKSFSIKIVGITGNRQSSLAKLSNQVISITIKNEGSSLNLAPMASTTSSLVVGDLLASGLVSKNNFKEHHFARFHPGGNLGLKLKKVSDFMIKGKSLPLIKENDSLKKALKEISSKKKGVVAVTNSSSKIVGVITDGDVRRFFVSHDSFGQALSKDAMTRSPKIVRENASLRDALNIMEQRKITSLFVVNKFKKPVGIIHMHDCLAVIS